MLAADPSLADPVLTNPSFSNTLPELGLSAK
jgi:hypothetical protein